MLIDITVVILYFSIGVWLITLTHSLYSHIFHSRQKVFGIPIFGLSVELPTRFGIISSFLVVLISIPYISTFIYLPHKILARSAVLTEVLGLIIILFLPLFALLQIIGGPSLTKGILEFSLFVLSSSLIHQSIVGESTQYATLLGMGFVFGLISIYIGWLSIYIYGNKMKQILSGFFDGSDFGSTADRKLVLISTIIYFPLCSTYIVLSYWISSFLISTF